MGHGPPPPPPALHTCPQSPSKQMGQAALGAKDDPEENLGGSSDLRVSPVLVRNESTINYFCLLPSSKNGLLRVSPAPHTFFSL